MASKNKVRIYNRLFFKLYLNYAIMLLVTAVLICLIFMNLYTEMTMNRTKEEMSTQAEIISERTTEYIITDQLNDYLALIELLESVNGWDVYFIANPEGKNPVLSSRLETGDSYEDFISTPGYSQYKNILVNAFQGIPTTREGYDAAYDVPTITVGRPVYGLDITEVVGAVLVNQQVDEKPEIVEKSLSLIVLSSMVALGISFIIIIIFATELALPITRMRTTALELAAGNYHSKTEIDRNDEIGDLAKTVDILSEKLLENDIQRKNLDQMRLDFFANVSHELRTPITVVRAYTETLADGVVQDKELVGQYYDRMLSECKSMERLVGDLLILSKMQNPDFAIEKEPVNLQQIFDDIIRSAGAIAQKKSIAIEVVKDSPCSMILGDYDRLRQMFMVILDNAIKFSDESKTVHIKLTNTDKIRVSIKDEGVGIDPEDINNIFEKFYKSNLRQNASGTGLGLAIAKQIALKHDGMIEVYSNPGEGSEFLFTFHPFVMEESSNYQSEN